MTRTVLLAVVFTGLLATPVGAHHQAGRNVPQQVRYEAGRTEQAWCRNYTQTHQYSWCWGTHPSLTRCVHVRGPRFRCRVVILIRDAFSVGQCVGRVRVRTDRRNPRDTGRPWRGRVYAKGCVL